MRSIKEWISDSLAARQPAAPFLVLARGMVPCVFASRDSGLDSSDWNLYLDEGTCFGFVWGLGV
jgi:hypothetical protein